MEVFPQGENGRGRVISLAQGFVLVSSESSRVRACSLEWAFWGQRRCIVFINPLNVHGLLLLGESARAEGGMHTRVRASSPRRASERDRRGRSSLTG